MIQKTVADAKQALEGVKDGMTLMLGGFGLRPGLLRYLSQASPKILYWNWYAEG